MVKCKNCRYCTGQMEDEIEGEWFSFYICEIDGPIMRDTAEDDDLPCDLYVKNSIEDEIRKGIRYVD